MAASVEEEEEEEDGPRTTDADGRGQRGQHHRVCG